MEPISDDNASHGDVIIVLLQPKFEMNVAQVVRAAACFGVRKIELCQPRYQPASGRKGDRKPRPLRMKEYHSVQMEAVPFMPLTAGYTPVAVEYIGGAEPLWNFEHPQRAVYLFGPEDGSIEYAILEQCQAVVQIPSRFCLNLAASVNIVLYDRMCKLNHEG
jgi:tRNA(Leu) C34 or U34 (ribose-2'-O)-methylase TrmL